MQVDEKEQDEEDAPVGVAVGGAVAEGEAKDEAEKEEGKSEKESKGDMVIRKFTVEMEDVSALTSHYTGHYTSCHMPTTSLAAISGYLPSCHKWVPP